jgi:hypothetical protein
MTQTNTYNVLNTSDFCLFLKGCISASLINLLDDYYDPRETNIYLRWLTETIAEMEQTEE